MTEALCEFAKKELWLWEKEPDGETREAHLESAWRQTGEMPAELEPVEVPQESLYLWGYFLSMTSRRSGNGYSANPISNVELLAWQTLTGITLEPWELDVIDRFEHIYLQHHAPKPVKEKPSGN